MLCTGTWYYLCFPSTADPAWTCIIHRQTYIACRDQIDCFSYFSCPYDYLGSSYYTIESSLGQQGCPRKDTMEGMWDACSHLMCILIELCRSMKRVSTTQWDPCVQRIPPSHLLHMFVIVMTIIWCSPNEYLEYWTQSSSTLCTCVHPFTETH